MATQSQDIVGVPLIPASIAANVASPVAYGQWSQIHEDLAWLRREMPLGVAKVEDHDPFWVVTKHADIQEIGRQPDLFRNTRVRKVLLNQETDRMLSAPRPEDSPSAVNALVSMDAPEHGIFRRLTFADFAPKGIKGLDDQIRAIAREGIAQMIAHGENCEFVEDVALRYPLRVILELLGLPRTDEDRMLRMTQEFFSPQDPDFSDSAAEKTGRAMSYDAAIALKDFFDALTESRRANPTGDVASIIANSTINGEPISHWDAASYYITILTAGHDTTSSSTAGAVWALAERPDVFAAVKNDRRLIPGLVDEAIRWTSPVIHFMRTATQDYILRGQKIRAGDWLFLSYPSANRDEDIFEAPFEFRPDRKPNSHLAFGYGAHVCLGQHLAKMEMRIFFEEFFEHVASLELRGSPTRTISRFVGGVKELPIRYRIAG
ncbi:cytochrome P450 (plasmid) [Sphingobium sp. SJ10-10]|uniref:cytochrome P450 n=1 Tax=Sphingobium sp. SJ10-10 TaxID=3114999 RepID=UPI002E19833E|nr:cytochrome P450 [Sphingobium sp. SJ10-10]